MAELEPRDIQMMHVVYADGVGYSKLSLSERSRFDTLLIEAVAELPFAGKVLAKVDNGDGFALAFGGDPQVVADSALWLMGKFAASGQAAVRLGVHSGVGYLRASLAGPATLSGNCIEFAQRMMTLSDGKFIACSEAFRQSLLSTGSACYVGLPIYGRSKHDELLVSYPLTAKKRVECLFLMDGADWDSYKNVMDSLAKYSSEIHIAWPSERRENVAHLLSQQDLADRIIVTPSGREYCNALNREGQVKAVYIDPDGADHVRPLSKDVRSIRLTESWLDGERLRIEILGTHPVLPVGKPVTLSSPLYIERSADADLRQAVTNHESVILLRAPRKFGKTSAVLRAINHAEEAGVHPVVLDLRAATINNFTSSWSFYHWVIEQLMLQGNARVWPVWDDLFGPNSNLETALRQVLSPNTRGNFLVVDGVDRLFDCDFRDDFFGLLRSWHNRRAMQSDPFWDSLSILLSYSAEGQSLVTDVNQSPFNVGVHLTLEPFSEEQTQDLCALVGWEGGADIFSLAAGHPYLTSQLLGDLVNGRSLAEAISTAAESPYISHLREQLVGSNELRTAARELATGGHTDDQASMWRLLALGLFAPNATGKLRVANRLFKLLLEDVMSKG